MLEELQPFPVATKIWCSLCDLISAKDGSRVIIPESFVFNEVDGKYGVAEYRSTIRYL